MVVKDWMALAAQEIASHFTYGPGRDSYVTDEQRWNIARNFTDIISKHSPFRPDVAYIPVPQCETCTHWLGRLINIDTFERTAPSPTSLNECGQIYAGSGKGIYTKANFGCVQWKTSETLKQEAR